MKKIKNILYYFLFLALVACTEVFPIKTIDFEDVMIVESTITDELKQQMVKLSRTRGLTDFDQAIVENANVHVESSDGSFFEFSQDTETGYYISNLEFQAIPDVTYTLKISTQNGQSYKSKVVTLAPAIPINRIYSEAVVMNEIDGVQVFVDIENQMEIGQYFRFEYEETYEISLPFPSPFSWEINGFAEFGAYNVELSERRIDEKCYSTIKSKGILQNSTGSLDQNKIVRFPVRFIASYDPKIKEQYSILVKQYAQSQEANTFYRILEDLGNVETILSQGQPGFVTGNIVSENNPDEKIMGFFEVSSVSSQRIFFNYKDFGWAMPSFFRDCEELILPPYGELRRKLEFENYQVFFYAENPGPIYFIAHSKCTECASYSTHIKPDFWEDAS